MNVRHLLIVCATETLFNSALAQTAFVFPDAMPQEDTLIYQTQTFEYPGIIFNPVSGENVTWDFSQGTLVETTDEPQGWLSAVGQPFQGFFPDADYGAFSQFPAVTLVSPFVSSPDSLWAIGQFFTNGVDVDTSRFEDPVTWMKFPFNYDDLFVDVTIDGSYIDTITTHYLGYGTLITPFGTVLNAILVSRSFTEQFDPPVELEFYTVDDCVIPIGAFSFANGGMYHMTFPLNITEGVEVVGAGDFGITPNPTTGLLRIDGLEQDSKGELIVMDAIGKEVLRSSIGSSPAIVDLSDRPDGTYLLTVRSERAVITRRVIKK